MPGRSHRAFISKTIRKFEILVSGGGSLNVLLFYRWSHSGSSVRKDGEVIGNVVPRTQTKDVGNCVGISRRGRGLRKLRRDYQVVDRTAAYNMFDRDMTQQYPGGACLSKGGKEAGIGVRASERVNHPMYVRG